MSLWVLGITVAILGVSVLYYSKVTRFSKNMECIGQSTISTIAKAGPESKVSVSLLCHSEKSLWCVYLTWKVTGQIASGDTLSSEPVAKAV